MYSAEQPTLLIVDDNPTNIKVLFEFLKESGFRVLIAKDGESTLVKLESVTPDLILLDVMMPGIDGFETCRLIKENPKYKDLPIIFMTALEDTHQKVKGLSIGAVDYITKPFQQEEVLARVKLHLNLRNLTQQELAKKNAQLNELNTSLEQKVEARTTELKEAQSQLVLKEKMSSLGQMVAGIAHEINNPLTFIGGNLKHASDFAEHLISLILLYQKYYPKPAAEIHQKIQEIDLNYIVEDFPRLLKSMNEGTKRISNISQSMRTFYRGDNATKTQFDIHEGIDSTLMILAHRLKANEQRPEISIVKQYGNLPEINCYSGQLNQVFMNLLANAIDALEESNAGLSVAEIKTNSNCITIKTEVDAGNAIVIYIQDNGIGIPTELKSQIFEPLFTTKGVGKGTGLGLSITRQIIEDKHEGTLHCNSTPGKGTEFVITIPIGSIS
jgi:signal transduction histidine kinase